MFPPRRRAARSLGPTEECTLMPFAHPALLAALPGFAEPKTYVASPVWSESTRTEVRFQPMPKKAATRLWHRARGFDRQTRQKGRHGGNVDHSALQVLHALVSDFLNVAAPEGEPSQFVEMINDLVRQ
jgi:hypothetical protein